MSLHRSVGMRGELLLMCLVHKMKKVVRKVREGAISLPEKYSKLLVEAIPGHKEEQLPLVGQGCKIGPRSEQKQTKEGNSFQGIMIKIPEAIDGQ